MPATATRRALTVLALAAAASLLPWPATAPNAQTTAGGTRPAGVQRLVFSAAKHPGIRRHFRDAVRRGWPRTLVVNRRDADERRERLLAGIPTRRGYDRDEYPPAVGGGGGQGSSAAATRAAGRPTCATQFREPVAGVLARGPIAAVLQRHSLPLCLPLGQISTPLRETQRAPCVSLRLTPQNHKAGVRPSGSCRSPRPIPYSIAY
jgi:hypothetical protein